MNRSWMAILIASVLLAVLGLSIYASVQWGNTRAVRDDTRCPNCNMELPPLGRATGECPYCKLREGGSPATPGERKRGDGSSPFGWGGKKLLFVLAGIGGIGVLGVGTYWVARSWRAKQRECFHHFRCPACNRKLRYRGRQAGHQAMCPGCRRPCTLPTSQAKATG